LERLGGYAAYGEIIKHLNQYYDFIQPAAFGLFSHQTNKVQGPATWRSCCLPDVFWENQWQIEAKIPLQARAVPASDANFRNKWITISTHTCAVGQLPAALMVHDSFAHQLKQFLTEDSQDRICLGLVAEFLRQNHREGRYQNSH